MRLSLQTLRVLQVFMEDPSQPRYGLELMERTAVKSGTIYPALLKLEQEGYISSSWGTSDNNRRAKFYALTRAGRKQLEREAREWERTADIIARFLSPKASS